MRRGFVHWVPIVRPTPTEHRSQWASQSLSWVRLLEAELAGVGHPVDMVDLAISGSKTGSEAKSYDLTAPGYSDASFSGMLSPAAHTPRWC